MLHQINKALGSTVLANDGETIGEIKDLYFDDHHWTVRYFVVNTAGWPSEKLVLLSPYAIKGFEWNGGSIKTSLSRKQVEECPPANSEQTVSRLLEEKYSHFYGWPLYWASGGGVWPNNLYPQEFVTQSTSPELTRMYNQKNAAVDEKLKQSHLRSYTEVKGYKVNSQGDQFGNVEDMIIEEKSYTIRFLVIDTVSFWPSKSVLVSPQWIDEIDWVNNDFKTKLSKESIKSSPAYHADQFIDRSYEEELYKVHGENPYWKITDTEGWIPGIDREKKKNSDLRNNHLP